MLCNFDTLNGTKRQYRAYRFSAVLYQTIFGLYYRIKYLLNFPSYKVTTFTALKLICNFRNKINRICYFLRTTRKTSIRLGFTGTTWTPCGHYYLKTNFPVTFGARQTSVHHICVVFPHFFARYLIVLVHML
jgi:hypothetical protein